MKNNDLRVYGKNCICSCDSDVTGINNNAIICGGSGSGKTMSIVEPTLIKTHDSSLIVTMTKRKLVDMYSALFRKRGYKVYELNYVQPELSNCSLDLLDYVDDDNDLDYLANALALIGDKENYRSKDPFWDFSAVSLLRAFLGLEYYTEKDHSFAKAIKRIFELKIKKYRDDYETNYNLVFDEAKKLLSDVFESTYFAWEATIENPYNTFCNVYTTLSARINPLVKNPCIDGSDKPKLDLASLGDEKSVLFIVTSPVDKTMNNYVNIIYSVLFRRLFEHAEKQRDLKLKVPVQIICDDFATGCPINSFPEYISIIREKNISTMILVQSESQIDYMYGPQNTNTIINNCDTYVYLGGMDSITAKSISTKTNLPLEEVLWLPIGEIFVFRRGEKPIRTIRYEITKDNDYIKLLCDYTEETTQDKTH